MADSDSDEEKTEDATPRREEKAREEGQIPRSRELTTFLMLLGGVIGLAGMGPTLFGKIGGVMEQAFLFDRRQVFETTSMLIAALDSGKRVLFAMMPLYLLLALIAMVAPALLGGWLISAKSMQPKISKLNPVSGIKRIFALQALIELFKALFKALLVGSVAASFLYLNVGKFLSLMDLSVRQGLATALMMAAQAAGLMVLALIVVILIDIPFQLYSHAKKLRMSKDEVKREHKESEGDPQVKARIRQQQQAMARGRMMSEVPDADVVITNPTHYAVALKYQEGRMGAPRLVAKGADAVADRIREVGEDARVPRLEAAPLARALYHHVDLDTEIPAQLYTAVAEVMAWAYRLRHVTDQGGEVPPTPEHLPVPPEMDSRNNGSEASP
ncbi:flagellar biosynthesis protein FlhB [Vreelandella jeotgali]|uniref:flagellar biosynthesis protein FlhB n=1 Tax=Vreelandella jeotgali TaxID=553386 RepID=UPI0003491290|nr:flagellar biosynthesis protein FlhB [Halomonas jeotgali]